MKTIKLGIAIICAAMSAFSAFAAPIENQDQIAALSAALDSGGVTGMLSIATGMGVGAPWMPDKWHVENLLKEPERIRLANAGREFGIKLAQQLELIAETFQSLPPGQGLHELSTTMCALAEWVNEPDGIGNLLLTGKCLDLASVGLGRIAADIDIPLESCRELTARIRKDEGLIDIVRRSRILDVESGTELFSECRDSDDMERVWVAGAQRDGRNRKGFFAHLPHPDPPTVVNRLVKGANHRNALAGVRARSMTKALGLLDFRMTVGYFPEPWVRSEEEKDRLEKEIAEAAKWGRKIVPREQEPSFDPLEVAFQKAWLEKVPDIKRSNDYGEGFRAYKEVSEGCFFDEDTAMIRLKQDGERLMKEYERKREHSDGL